MIQYKTSFTSTTVDWEIFAVKNFSPVALAAKIKRAESFLWWMIRACACATWRKLNAWTFLTRKKSCAKVSQSTVFKKCIDGGKSIYEMIYQYISCKYIECLEIMRELN